MTCPSRVSAPRLDFSHVPFHYSQLYLTVSNSFYPLSDTNFTFELDSFSSTTPFVLRIRSTPNLKSPISFEPPVQNMNSTSTQANPPPAFSISSSGPESPPSVLTPELSSDFIYHKNDSNWRTAVINATSITHKNAEISATAEYCDPDLMLITKQKYTVVFSHQSCCQKVTWASLEGIGLWRGHDSDKKTVILLLTLYSRLPPKMRLNWSGPP